LAPWFRVFGNGAAGIQGGRAGGAILFGFECQALQHLGWSLFSGVVLLFGFVFLVTAPAAQN
jgi:hypothetical protein